MWLVPALEASLTQHLLSSKELSSTRLYTFTGLVNNLLQEKYTFLLSEAGQPERLAARSAVKHIPCNETETLFQKGT